MQGAAVQRQFLCQTCCGRGLARVGLEVDDGDDPQVIVKSAVAGADEVLYEAPPPGMVPDAMAAFPDGLCHEAALPVLIRAALAHRRFASVHPCSDGNGRIGRAVIEQVFARAGAALPFPLSRQIEADKRGYFAALQAGRRVTGAGRVGRGISAGPHARIAGVSAAMATRDLADLEGMGVIVRGAEGGRSTRYRLALQALCCEWQGAMAVPICQLIARRSSSGKAEA